MTAEGNVSRRTMQVIINEDVDFCLYRKNGKKSSRFNCCTNNKKITKMQEIAEPA